MIPLRLRGALREKTAVFLEAYLPTRMKRLACLASLGAYLNGSTSLDADTMSKLNTLMVLGADDSALKLPVYLSKVIWEGKVHEVVLEKEAVPSGKGQTVTQIATSFIAAMPAWLRYGEESVIREEVEKLVANCHTSFATV